MPEKLSRRETSSAPVVVLSPTASSMFSSPPSRPAERATLQPDCRSSSSIFHPPPSPTAGRTLELAVAIVEKQKLAVLGYGVANGFQRQAFRGGISAGKISVRKCGKLLHRNRKASSSTMRAWSWLRLQKTGDAFVRRTSYAELYPTLTLQWFDHVLYFPTHVISFLSHPSPSFSHLLDARSYCIM
jgi:hypothetical protein